MEIYECEGDDKVSVDGVDAGRTGRNVRLMLAVKVILMVMFLKTKLI